MDTDALLAQLETDGPLVAEAAVRAGWDARVPGLAWDVREVVAHTGAVHRWAADVVARALPVDEVGGSAAFMPDADDGALVAWFLTGHAVLVADLREAPEDLVAFTFLRGDPSRRFWIRRQAHETAIHRADVEAAAGAVTPFDAAFAQDGLAEVVDGFGSRRNVATSTAGTLALIASDGPSRVVTFGGERTVSVLTDDVGRVDAAVHGTSSDLYLWAWNRPSAVEITGDAAIAGLWRNVRVE